MYAVKVRPPKAVAWFWLRDWEPYRITTRREYAATWADHDGAAEAAATVCAAQSVHIQVVRLGGHHL